MSNYNYIFKSPKFEGFVTLEFDKQGYLTRFDMNEADLSEEQKRYILSKLPRHIDLIRQLLHKSKGATLEKQMSAKVTFDQFWDRYDEKARSSKKVSLRIWSRLTQTQRDRAFNFITSYERNIPHGVSKKYAETYLRAELWNN